MATAPIPPPLVGGSPGPSAVVAGGPSPRVQKNYYKEGFLTKQGNSVKTWKKRWVVVKTTGNSASLYYFKAKTDKMPAGIIPVCH